MSDLNFDPNGAFDAYRNALAPTLHAQQQSLKTIESFGRYQYAIAGDYLEWSLAQAKATLAANSPAELAATQTALATQFGERFKSRVQELVDLAAGAQSSFNQMFSEASAKVAKSIKKNS
ncbi:MAG TPA: phasin family protein [Steroidobacteraceae bacterium]|nr:phasin family protein [Steroidobacteraceae bacterium]